MAHRLGGILILLLALSALQGGDSQDKQPTPAAQYEALVKDADNALLAYVIIIKGSGADRDKVLKNKPPNFAPEFLALAEKYPNDPVALEALVRIVSDHFGPRGNPDPTYSKALQILLQQHVQSEKLGDVCESLAERIDVQDAPAFLVAVLDKSTRKEVQAEACLALAQLPQLRARMSEELKKDPDSATQLADEFGKEILQVLQKLNVKQEAAESEKYFRRFTDKYLAEMSVGRVADLCVTLGYNTDSVSEGLLRTFLEKDGRTEIKGTATLCLGKLLKNRAASLWDTQADQAVKLMAESETLLERAADKYADVPHKFFGTIGKQANKELFALRFLSVGKVAPDIEGEDQDGNRFKLSDYRGKVVLLDFWSQT